MPLIRCGCWKIEEEGRSLRSKLKVEGDKFPRRYGGEYPEKATDADERFMVFRRGTRG
jgi:hypothetical protein